MFSNIKSKWHASITVRVTGVYALLFLISFFIIFSVLYWLVSVYLQSMHDRLILTKKKEIENLLAKTDTTLTQLAIYMQHESVASGTEHIFLCLRSGSGEILASSDSVAWQMILKKTPCFIRHPINTTVSFNSKHTPVTISYFPQNNGQILQIVVSRKEDLQFLAYLTKLLGGAYFFVITTALLLGSLMVKHILRPLDAITKTAQEISLKNLRQRVPVSGVGGELDQLSLTLNEMLARIEQLVAGMQTMSENLAHDLCAPITHMLGMCEVALLKERSCQEYREILEGCMSECDHTLVLLNTVLDISELEAGIISMAEPTLEISMPDTFLSVLEMFQPVAELKGLLLQYNHCVIATISGDSKRLRQMLANLLDNAIKYTPAGGKITLTTSVENGHFVLHLADTGIGIDTHDLPHIFEKFYRSDRSRSHPGHGLGLAFAKAVAEAHRGSISVMSQPGQGTVFHIQLPLKR